MQGHFADFETSEPLDGKRVSRQYKSVRAELKFPCEHKLTSPCAMEMQIYAEETLESIQRNKNERPNIVFALLFEEDTAKSYFDEAILTQDKKELFDKLIEMGPTPKIWEEQLTFNFMKALSNADLLPASKFSDKKLETLTY